jgi:hypothetical protein
MTASDRLEASFAVSVPRRSPLLLLLLQPTLNVLRASLSLSLLEPPQRRLDKVPNTSYPEGAKCRLNIRVV